MRRKQAVKEWGMSISQSYVQEGKGLIPEFISIGARSKAIPVREVEIINAARISGKSDDEIRAIIIMLLEDRKSLGMEAIDYE